MFRLFLSFTSQLEVELDPSAVGTAKDLVITSPTVVHFTPHRKKDRHVFFQTLTQSLIKASFLICLKLGAYSSQRRALRKRVTPSVSGTKDPVEMGIEANLLFSASLPSFRPPRAVI